MKSKIISNVFASILLLTNLILAFLLIICSYCPYLNPIYYPYLTNAGLAFPIFFFGNILFLLFWIISRWKYALLPIFSLLLCYHQCREYMPINLFRSNPPKRSIKFLSYNVMAFEGDKPNTKKSPNKILVYLQNCDADIICLQEFILGSQLKKKDIDNVLSKYPYRHHFSLANGQNGLGCYSRYPILEAIPIKYASKANGSIIYKIKKDKDTLMIINNHLESNKLTAKDKKMYRDLFSENEKKEIKNHSKYLIDKLADAVKIRALQAATISRIIKNRKTQSLIVCGDFNDSPLSYTHQILEKGLVDAFTESGNGMGISYHQNRFYFRIDNILISNNLKSYFCTIDNKIKNSDHYPIWCFIHEKEK